MEEFIQEQGKSFVFVGPMASQPEDKRIEVNFQVARILKKRCLICGGCLDVCPTQALFGMDLSTTTPPQADPDRCVGCLNCMEECPSEAIVLEDQGEGFCFQKDAAFHGGDQEITEKLKFQILNQAMIHAKENSFDLIVVKGASLPALACLSQSKVPWAVCFPDRSLHAQVRATCSEREIIVMGAEESWETLLDRLS